jgi:hypothetical protein
MKRIIRLTEQDLARIVRRVISEQPKSEVGGDPKIKDEGGADRDWWKLDLAPKLKAAGFVSKTEPEVPGLNRPCHYKCCTYMYKGNHNTGTNVFLVCGPKSSGVWKIKVYNKGNQNLKSFDAGKSGAEAAVKYALSLG